jgi:hypothetical protein
MNKHHIDLHPNYLALKKMNINIIDRYILKSKTNTGSDCKQYFYLIKNDDSFTIAIHKYMLVELPELKYYMDLKPVKQFKSKSLYFEHFGIKLDSLMIALMRFDDIINPE